MSAYTQPIPKGNAMNKNAAISSSILNNIANGMTLEAAYDAVFGDGSYDKMVGDIYDALRTKAAA